VRPSAKNCLAQEFDPHYDKSLRLHPKLFAIAENGEGQLAPPRPKDFFSIHLKKAVSLAISLRRRRENFHPGPNQAGAQWKATEQKQISRQTGPSAYPEDGGASPVLGATYFWGSRLGRSDRPTTEGPEELSAELRACPYNLPRIRLTGQAGRLFELGRTAVQEICRTDPSRIPNPYDSICRKLPVKMGRLRLIAQPPISARLARLIPCSTTPHFGIAARP